MNKKALGLFNEDFSLVTPINIIFNINKEILDPY
jgi:hypothetical protein